MNVLLFVMTMLMLLALMTYSRFDIYRSSQAFQSIFKDYMEKDERGYFNLEAKSTYDKITVKTKDGKAAPKAEGSPRIGVKLLIDKTLREKQSKEWMQTQILLKNLMNTLFDKQPFFIAAVEERHTLLDDLISEVTQAIDALPKDQLPKSASGLANLKLNDPQLDLVLYKMLQGSVYKEINPKDKANGVSKIIEPAEVDVDLSSADQTPGNDAAEFKSIKGYYSLLDFITASASPKVRVYLAPKEVLQSIFHDPQVVDNIILERKQLFKRITADGDAKELTTAFKDQFNGLKDSSIDEGSLNYQVTKTNPKNYE